MTFKKIYVLLPLLMHCNMTNCLPTHMPYGICQCLHPATNSVEWYVSDVLLMLIAFRVDTESWDKISQYVP